MTILPLAAILQLSVYAHSGSSCNIAAILPPAAILQLSEYASFGNKFILPQYCCNIAAILLQYFDFDKGTKLG